MVYQPMLELLDYLRAHGFKTFIVSGSGVDFIRPWVEKAFGIPPEQVVGSTIKTKFELRKFHRTSNAYPRLIPSTRRSAIRLVSTDSLVGVLSQPSAIGRRLTEALVDYGWRGRAFRFGRSSH
jgi:hypothetical protein